MDKIVRVMKRLGQKDAPFEKMANCRIFYNSCKEMMIQIGPQQNLQKFTDKIFVSTNNELCPMD
jgi:hypothetical protein